MPQRVYSSADSDAHAWPQYPHSDSPVSHPRKTQRSENFEREDLSSLKKTLKQKLNAKSSCEGQVSETWHIQRLVDDWEKNEDQEEPLEDFLRERLHEHRESLQSQVEALSQEIVGIISTLKQS